MKKVFLLLIALSTLFTLNLSAAKNLYLNILKEPKSVYKNQKFEIKVKALVTTNDFTSLTTNFSNQSNITVLNPSSPWKKITNDTYENSFYFKVKSQKIWLSDVVDGTDYGRDFDFAQPFFPQFRQG